MTSIKVPVTVPTMVHGRMGGAPSESDSSDGSSHGTAELDFQQPNEAPHSSSAQPRAVETNEIFMVSLPLTPPTPSVPDGTKFPADALCQARPVANAFGIAYTPCGTTEQQGHVLASGPSFVDEEEFEQEMDAEFRVLSGWSGESAEIPKSPDQGQRTSIDDFDDIDGTCGGQNEHQLSSRTLRTSGGVPSGTLASHEQGLPSGSKSKLLESAVVASKRKNPLKVDNRAALKQVTEGYTKAISAPQAFEIAPLVDQSVQSIEQLNYRSSVAANAGVSVHVSGDVRQYPVMEEVDETVDDEERGEQVSQEEEDNVTLVANQGDKLETLNAQGEEKDEQQPKTEGEKQDARLARVAEEWEAIDQLRTVESSMPMEKGVGGTLQPISVDQDNCLVSTQEVLRYFKSQDLTVYKKDIITFQPSNSRFHLFRRIPKLKFPDGNQLREEVFLLAQIKYTPGNVMHRRLIQTIYRRMTNDKRACPDVGPHWDTIGFQGTDPCTDLNRSMGVFALLQVLFLLETQQAFAMVLRRFSQVDVTGWPFLCVSIGFTKEAVGVLRRGSCYSECNRRGRVLEVINELHQAQFHAFLELCRKEPGTHHALHLAKVRTKIASDPDKLVKAYRSYLSVEKATSAVGVAKWIGEAATRQEFLDFSGREMRVDQRGI